MTTSQAAKTFHVAVSDLAVDPENVRQSCSEKAIEELADSILAHGLLQNLVVRPDEETGKFLVSAGGRRLRALKLLVERNVMEQDALINCVLRDEEEAKAASLAENIMRVAMDPADEFAAFAALIDQGRTIEEVAHQFGTTPLLVTKRLKLALVSPMLFDLYRKGYLSISQLQAFTVSDDHAAQERVWTNLPQYYRSSRDITRALTEGSIAASDKRVTFIGGIDAVRAAGGEVSVDLFSEEAFVLDTALLDKLLAEKVDALSEEISAEGWKWVHYQPEIGYGEFQSFGRVYPAPLPMTEEDTQARALAVQEVEDFEERFNESGDEGDRQACELAEQRVSVIDEKYPAVYSKEQMASAGVVLSIAWNGTLQIERGLIDPRDTKDAAALHASNDDVKASAVHSKALLRELSARKTAALRAELAERPDVALAVCVHALAISTFYNRLSAWNRASGVQVSLDSACLDSEIKDAGQVEDLNDLETLREDWKEALPENPADLLDWCLAQSQETLLKLHAFFVAQSLNGIDGGDGYNRDGMAHLNKIGMVLEVDMTSHYEPDAEGYFSRVKLETMHDCVAEVCGPEAAEPVLKMKKKDAARYTEQKLKGSGWLPEGMAFAEPMTDDA